MHPQLKHSYIGNLAKFLRLALITLIGLISVFGQTSASQTASLQESFRGTFQQEPNSDKGGSNYPSIVFVESNGEKKLGIIAPSVYRLIPQQEYLLNGIFVQKHLSKKPKSDEYKKLVKSAWPDGDSAALKSTAKEVKDWIKKNPEKPLVLVCSLRKADSSIEQKRNPIRIGENVQESKLIKKVEPVYPQAAMQNRISGKVRLQITVDEEGNVEEITPKSGDPLLVASAIDAVQQWQYSPTLLNGNPVPVIAEVTVFFKMNP
jgi:TonB family protein